MRRALMRGATAMALALLCAACAGAPPGYHGDRGSFTPVIGSGG